VSAPYPSPQRLAQAYRRTGREDLAQKELEAFEKLQPREPSPALATPPPPNSPPREPGDRMTCRILKGKSEVSERDFGRNDG